MKNSMDFFTRTFQTGIYEKMIQAAEDTNLIQVLEEMQTKQGVEADAAKNNAKLCIAAVASCESVYDSALEDRQAVINQLLNHVHTKPAQTQEVALHKLYFGLTAHQDPQLAEKLAEGASVEDLFWKYYTRQEEHPIPAAELENAIKKAADGFVLSGELMKAQAKKMEATGKYLATAAALGENGANYKCVVAMELYLNSQGTMTIHEAANVACAGVQTQAVADAVSRGILTRDMAKKILIVAAIAAVVIGVGILLYNAGAAAMAAKTASTLANAPYLMEMPEVFAPFAVATSASGTPLTYSMLASGEAVAAKAAELKGAAVAKEAVGVVVAALGTAAAVLSDRTAALIGKLSTMFQKDTKPLADGLNAVAECGAEAYSVWTEEETVADTQKTAVESQATVHA